MSETWLLERLAMIIPLVLSLSVHEWAHAISAYRLGDDTAERQGRLTLNPVSHIDPIGTLLLPMLGVPFGWAKPVPFDPTRFRRGVDMRTGTVVVAVAGPFSNLVLALLCVLIHGGLLRFSVENDALQTLLINGFFLNIVLAVFNMLPIPPLDGSRVADWLMPRSLRPQWESFARLGPIVLLALVFLPSMIGQSVFSWPAQFAWRSVAIPLLSMLSGVSA
jgi:Zn-dependent protease